MQLDRILLQGCFVLLVIFVLVVLRTHTRVQQQQAAIVQQERHLLLA